VSTRATEIQEGPQGAGRVLHPHSDLIGDVAGLIHEGD